MLLTVAIIFVLLGLVFLAFRGFFGVFPDNWEWVGVLLAGIGLAMATPSIFQIIFGRPSLRLRFENGVEEAKRFLPVYIENTPIKSRLLKKIGIKRDSIQSLTIQFQLCEAGSGKIVIPIHQARIYSDDDPTDMGRNRISVPPTFSVAASIIVAMWDAGRNKAVILPDRLREQSELEPGQYKVNINFSIDGEPMIVSRQFVVGRKADDLSWVKPARVIGD